MAKIKGIYGTAEGVPFQSTWKLLFSAASEAAHLSKQTNPHIFQQTLNPFYQTRQAGLRTIGALGLHPKALAKSAEFDTTPLTRYIGSECSFDRACNRMACGVWFSHQICA